MSTQVILTGTVDNLGVDGDVVEVRDGYARNFLIPKGLAIPATAANLRRVEALKKKREAALAAQVQEAKSVAEKLSMVSCTIRAAAGADGKLYGSVTAADIAEQLRSEGITVDRRRIHLEHPIHELGAHDVEIKLHPEVAVRIKVWVVSAESPASSGTGSSRTAHGS